MKTLKGTLTIDFKAVIPQQLLDDMRAAALRPDATAFLLATQAKHPVNDDAFVAAILKNAVRHSTRDNLLALFHEAGVGGTVSPATVDVIELPEDFGGSVQPQVVTPSNTTKES
jgi:hypothetical protein